MKKIIVMLNILGLLTASGCSDVKITPKDKHLFLSYLETRPYLKDYLLSIPANTFYKSHFLFQKDSS